MKIICAWCNKELKKSSDEKQIKITHGICTACFNKVFKEISNKRKSV